MFPLTPDQHHWLEVATEDEGWEDVWDTGQKYTTYLQKRFIMYFTVYFIALL